jgi:hypothetical protein
MKLIFKHVDGRGETPSFDLSAFNYLPNSIISPHLNIAPRNEAPQQRYPYCQPAAPKLS